MLTLHPMKEKDLPQVAAIEVSIFSQPWSEKGFLDALHQKAAFYLVAAEKEKILGYCGFYQSFDEADTRTWQSGRASGAEAWPGPLTELLKEGKNRGVAHFTLEVG